MSQRDPAQRKSVHRLIDWEPIRSRCERYPAVGRAFPTEMLKKHCDSPPFYDEILVKIDLDLKTSYDLCMPFALPKNSDRSQFLDTILSRFLDPRFLEIAKENAEKEYPVPLYRHPESSLCVYIEGPDCGAYMPGIVLNQTGSPDVYLELALKEAARAKKNSNELENYHPNLVAVNFLLSKDFQVAKHLKRSSVQPPTLPLSAGNIDALAVCAVGIDERLTREDLKVVIRSDGAERNSLFRIASLWG